MKVKCMINHIKQLSNDGMKAVRQHASFQDQRIFKFKMTTVDGSHFYAIKFHKWEDGWLEFIQAIWYGAWMIYPSSPSAFDAFILAMLGSIPRGYRHLIPGALLLFLHSLASNSLNLTSSSNHRKQNLSSFFLVVTRLCRGPRLPCNMTEALFFWFI